MTTEHQPRFTSQQLSDQIKGHIETLATATDAARVSEEMLRYLETCARFHQYSFNNILLIMMSYPQASRVAGFHAWNKLNRYVRKGEHGIPILAPILVTVKDEKQEPTSFLRGFKVVFVFDISQTEGEPLAEVPSWKSVEKNALLQERLVGYAQENGITVTEQALPNEIQGVSKGRSILIAPVAGTSTLIHEIAHELMHRRPDAPSESPVRELEAEAVAYVVGKHFGLESSGSPNYIAMYGVSSELVLKHLERISATSRKMIEAIEG